MPLTDHEMRQLVAIEDTIRAEDPELADKLRRMSGYTIESRRMALTASVTLLGSSPVLLGVGAGLHYPLCSFAGVLTAVAAVSVAGGWALWARNRRAARPSRKKVAASQRAVAG